MYFRNNDEVLNQDSSEVGNDRYEDPEYDECEKCPMLGSCPYIYGNRMMPYQMMPSSMDYDDDPMYRSFWGPGFDFDDFGDFGDFDDFDDPADFAFAPSGGPRRRRRRRRGPRYPVFPWWWWFFL